MAWALVRVICVSRFLHGDGSRVGGRLLDERLAALAALGSYCIWYRELFPRNFNYHIIHFNFHLLELSFLSCKGCLNSVCSNKYANLTQKPTQDILFHKKHANPPKTSKTMQITVRLPML
jgi:hypothetical protein